MKNIVMLEMSAYGARLMAQGSKASALPVLA